MITSTGNTKMRRIVNLERKAKLRYSEGVFIVEGLKMFLEAPKGLIEEVYVSEGFMAKNSRELFENICYEMVSDEVFQKISDTQTPQGILCVMKMPSYSMKTLLEKKHKLFLLLEDLQDPGNLGTIFRSGEGAGVDGVIMTKNTVDILIQRSSVPQWAPFIGFRLS